MKVGLSVPCRSCRKVRTTSIKVWVAGLVPAKSKVTQLALAYSYIVHLVEPGATDYK